MNGFILMVRSKKILLVVISLLFIVNCQLLTVNSVSAQTFTVSAIPDSVFARMQGKSYPKGCTVARSDLCYLRLSHWTSEGSEQIGELVCNKAISADLIDIFRALYEAHYVIERLQLIDDFDADDERSMQANNTSCFCFRRVAGSQKLSRHAVGMAVDLNPLYNPCVRLKAGGQRTVQPATATPYADRRSNFPHKITKSDLAYRLFTAHGFRWGGVWRSVKDYQHFEK